MLSEGPRPLIPGCHHNSCSFDGIRDGWEANAQEAENNCEGWDEDIPTGNVNDYSTGVAGP